MKLGVYTNLFANLELDDCLERLAGTGIEAVEIAAGNYNGSAHCPVDELLASDDRCREYRQKFNDHGLEICALTCHGNVLHPSPGETQALQVGPAQDNSTGGEARRANRYHVLGLSW